MPALPSDIVIEAYYNVRHLPRDFLDALESNPRNANIILPQINKALAEERALNHSTTHPAVWLTCKNAYLAIEFILAVTEGYMGSYPVFIYTTLPFDSLRDNYIRPCIRGLVAKLSTAVPLSRVYSIFAPAPISTIFAQEWTRQTGIKNYLQRPFYAAKITHCTARTLNRRKITIDASLGYNLRPGIPEDIPAIGELCHIFSSDSAPFVLTPERAIDEAERLVRMRQVWVHEARRPGRPAEIASIVAFTRNSDRVAAITKVCTNPNWRRLGCAERLVRRVCEHFLRVECKDSVILYVAHDNSAANIVYQRVGFVGLAQGEPKVEGVDPWLEIGFDLKQVTLGHW